MVDPGPGGLPDPAVAPDAYDEEYYRHGCAGADEWHTSEGEQVAALYPGMLQLARLRPGEVVVDVGAGRGELVALAAEGGAAQAIGFDYSEAAVALAARTIERRGVGDRARVELVDARRLPLEDGCADLVTLLDVVEHMTPPELDATLGEAFRVLRPGGRVFIHTMPNRHLYDVAYRVHRGVMRLLGRRWPADPRLPYERAMHVNEQTVGGLRRTVRRAGFTSVRVVRGRWVHADFVPSPRQRRLYHAAARVPGLDTFVLADMFATGIRP